MFLFEDRTEVLDEKQYLNNLVHSWKMDTLNASNTVNDSSGTVDFDTRIGTVTVDNIEVVLNSSMDFNSNSCFVRTGDTVVNYSDEISIEAWINPDMVLPKPSPPRNSYIINRESGSTGFSIFIRGTGADVNKITCRVYNVDNIAVDIMSKTLIDNINTYYHVALTCDGNILRLYINGIEENNVLLAGSANGMSSPATCDLLLGGLNSPQNDSFEGKIDEVRIYNKSLTAVEILDRYNNP